MVEATNLARWVLRHSGRPVSHLKLQKLAFYCFGAASAYDLDTLIGDVRFEAWEHGPVNRSVYNEYKAFGATPIDPPSTCVEYPAEVTRVLADSLAIYGSLDAWSLRQQSHLEEPWIASWKTGATEIAPDTIKAHFRRKFLDGAVTWPEYLADAGSLRLDRIPVHQFVSLHELADAFRHAAA